MPPVLAGIGVGRTGKMWGKSLRGPFNIPRPRLGSSATPSVRRWLDGPQNSSTLTRQTEYRGSCLCKVDGFALTRIRVNFFRAGSFSVLSVNSCPDNQGVCACENHAGYPLSFQTLGSVLVLHTPRVIYLPEVARLCLIRVSDCGSCLYKVDGFALTRIRVNLFRAGSFSVLPVNSCPDQQGVCAREKHAGYPLSFQPLGSVLVLHTPHVSPYPHVVRLSLIRVLVRSDRRLVILCLFFLAVFPSGLPSGASRLGTVREGWSHRPIAGQ